MKRERPVLRIHAGDGDEQVAGPLQPLHFAVPIAGIKIDEITNLGAVKIRLRSLIGALEEKGV